MAKSRAPYRLATVGRHVINDAKIESGTIPVPMASGTATNVAEAALHLTAGLRLLDQGGQSDLCAGFFSARHPDRPDLFLAPSHGAYWREATPSIFGIYSCKSRERLAGYGRLPNFPGLAVSAAIYSAFPEVNAVIHAHPSSVMAVAAADGPAGTILPMSESSFMFYERVKSLECNFFFDDAYLEKIVDALRDGSYCILMRNHSYIMTGRTIPECYIRSYMLAQSADVQLKVLAALGGNLPKIPDHDECLFHRRSYEGYEGCPPYDGQLEWPGLLRRLDREHPSWRGDPEDVARALSLEPVVTPKLTPAIGSILEAARRLN
mmetsp:Transcript_55510/g.154684  ORF Transcript_55510/g.154684 Transcript_55510/m.154684 type:complete len:321 (-) Transcript_55510:84-1046(-)